MYKIFLGKLEYKEDAALSRIELRLQGDRINPGKRHKAQESEHDQRAEGEPNAALKLGRLSEIGKAQARSHLI